MENSINNQYVISKIAGVYLRNYRWQKGIKGGKKAGSIERRLGQWQKDWTNGKKAGPMSKKLARHAVWIGNLAS